jgi:hypothetical protein
MEAQRHREEIEMGNWDKDDKAMIQAGAADRPCLFDYFSLPFAVPQCCGGERLRCSDSNRQVITTIRSGFDRHCRVFHTIHCDRPEEGTNRKSLSIKDLRFIGSSLR